MPFLRTTLTLALLSITSLALAQKPAANLYQFSVDLTKVTNDELAITLIPPRLKADKAVYRMPKVTPGTYSISSFGRFVNGFKALDASGAELPVKKLDDNNWEISSAKKLAKITYTVDDTWDTEISENFIFEPSGVSFERDSAFVINSCGLFGYFDDNKKSTYRIEITKPASFYGATSLVPVKSTATVDTWQTSSYFDLVDAPMLYSRPDTTILNIGGAQVLFATYTPSGKKWSKDISKEVEKVLLAAKDYLGGKLPVKKYAVLTYLSPTGFKSGSAGALEHCYSTFVALPEGTLEQIAGGLRDVVSHEFFHVVTPLSIHAEQIGNFDYADPKMSEHLWLYEGVTEYNSHISQVRSGVKTEQEFLDEMLSKMRSNDGFGGDSVSFTLFSRRVLEPDYQRYYGNVYAKGALIGMGLDIQLRKWSKGKYGVNTLLADLSKTYGKNKSFKDGELFAQITKLTNPSIGEYLRRHVAGKEPLPYSEWLSWAGIEYVAKTSDFQYTTGLVRGTAAPNPETGRFAATNLEQLGNDITRELGLQDGDVLLKFNGEDMTVQSYVAARTKFLATAKDGDPIEWVVSRKSAEGKDEELVFKTTAKKVEFVRRHQAKINPSPTPEQAALRKAWLHQ